MATKKQAKSGFIREFKSKNPSAKPAAISAAMKKAGLSATPQYVSMILSNDRRRSSGGSRKTKRVGADVTYSQLVAAKDLVEVCGSAEQAKLAIENLQRLSG